MRASHRIHFLSENDITYALEIKRLLLGNVCVNSFRIWHLVNANLVACCHVSQVLRGNDDELPSFLFLTKCVICKDVQCKLSSDLIQKHVVFIHQSKWTLNLQEKTTTIRLQKVLQGAKEL
jgi:hypothetical protein